MRPAVDMPKQVNILVVCDQFETGYDNCAVSCLGIDRSIGFEEKLVQVYNRRQLDPIGQDTVHWKCAALVVKASSSVDLL